MATGSQVAGWLAVEVPGAWGSDAAIDSDLGAHLTPDMNQRLRASGLRIITIRARHRDQSDGHVLYTCRVNRPDQPRATLWTTTIADLSEISEVADELLASNPERSGPEGSAAHRSGPDRSAALPSDLDRPTALPSDSGPTPALVPDHGPAPAPAPRWKPAEGPVFMICTNGRHDQCCAILARPVIRSLATSPWRDRVWECSHIGGDRFAPSLVALPQSWYFGRFDDADMDHLLTSITEDRIDLRYFRGRTSLTFAEQAAEHAMRLRLDTGEPVNDEAVVVTGRSGSMIQVRVGDQRYEVRVRRQLKVSTEPLSCKAPAGRQFPVFTVESITPVG